MENIISNNVRNIEISGIRKFYNKVSKVENAVSLTLGQPDFEVPLIVKDEISKALQNNKTTYTSNAGIVELREEISKYLSSMNIDYDKEEICITVGGSQGLMSVFTALINTGDNILIPTPAYPAYESCVNILGGNVINYNLNNDFTIDFDNLEYQINTYKPKVLVVSFPSNPTGSILTKEDNLRLYRLIKENEIIVVSDEMYASLCYEENYCSIAQYNDIYEKIILVGGFSKMFSMTGLRVGYVCAAEYLMKHIIKVHQYTVSCAPSISQWGAYAGLKYCIDDVNIMKNKFIERRDYIYERLVNMGFDVIKPKGAFYIFPSIKKFNISSEEFCERLLNEAKVAVIPGSAFGPGGEGHVRISYSYSTEEIEKAMERMRKFCAENNF